MEHKVGRGAEEVGEEPVDLCGLDGAVGVDDGLALECGAVPAAVVAPLVVVLHEDEVAPFDAGGRRSERK